MATKHPKWQIFIHAKIIQYKTFTLSEKNQKPAQNDHF